MRDFERKNRLPATSGWSPPNNRIPPSAIYEDGEKAKARRKRAPERNALSRPNVNRVPGGVSLPGLSARTGIGVACRTWAIVAGQGRQIIMPLW